MRRLVYLCMACLWSAPLYAASQHSVDDELAYRITFGRADDVKILLEKGANPNASSPQGDTMLILAIARNDSEAADIIAVLLEKGADPNLPDHNKNYPLLLAEQESFARAVTTLLAKGADIHVRTSNGATAEDIAKLSGNADIIAAVQQVADKEAAYAASLHSAARFKEIMHSYGFNGCTYQYWNYYKASRQNPEDDPKTEQRIAASAEMLGQLAAQIQKYYPSVKASDIQSVSDGTAQAIFTELDNMVSNRNRIEHGVGSEDDAKLRCQKISSAITVNFTPTDLQQ